MLREAPAAVRGLLPARPRRHGLIEGAAVNDRAKARIFADLSLSLPTTCCSWAPGVATRQAASRLLCSASALRVTRRNPRCNRLSMAGRRLPAMEAKFSTSRDSLLSSTTSRISEYARYSAVINTRQQGRRAVGKSGVVRVFTAELRVWRPSGLRSFSTPRASGCFGTPKRRRQTQAARSSVPRTLRPGRRNRLRCR